MANKDTTSFPYVVRIPLTRPEELQNYQRAILGVLDQVELTDCSPEQLENLRWIYRLLSHLILQGISSNGVTKQ